MPAVEEGTKCILRKGRRAGEEVEVVKVDGQMAVVKTAKGKERKASVTHLDPKAE